MVSSNTTLPSEPVHPHASIQDAINLRQILADSQQAVQILSQQNQLLESILKAEQLKNLTLTLQLAEVYRLISQQSLIALSRLGAAPTLEGEFLNRASPRAESTRTTTSLSGIESKEPKRLRPDFNDGHDVARQSPEKRARTQKF